MARHRFYILVLGLSAMGCVALAQTPDRVRNAARGEGLVRFAVSSCFASGSTERAKLGEQSTRYIQKLSAASAIAVAELERVVDDALAQAKAGKPLSAQQCNKGRDATIKLLHDRDQT